MDALNAVAHRLLLRPAEVGETLGVSRSRAYELINRGVIPSIRIGGSLRVPHDALRAWIETQVAQQASAPSR